MIRMTIHSVYCEIKMAYEGILQSLRLQIFSGILLFWLFTTGSGERDWDVRLAGSKLTTEGRVEVFLDGEWGTITDAYTWGLYEAQTVCNQLGFSYSNVASLERGYYGQGTGKVHLSYLNCKAGDTSLDRCQHIRVNNYNIFGHDFDAAVTCNGEIRLQGSKSTDSLNGIIQILTHNQWLNLCTSAWTKSDSEVACRRLGYTVGHVARLRSNDVSTSYYRWDYLCTGNERSLDQCPGYPNNKSHCQWHAYFLTCTDESSAPSSKNTSTFTLSTIAGSLVFLVIIIAVLLMYLISIKKRSSRHRRWITLAGGRQQCQPSERDRRRMRSRRVRGRNQRRSTPTVNSISNGQRGNDRDLPSYSHLEEDTPPPYSQLPLPRIEIPVVGRDERYEERAPRYTETDAIEFFQELDAEQLQLQYENEASGGPSQVPQFPAQPPGPPPDYDYAEHSQPERAPSLDRRDDITDITSHVGSISSDDEEDDISLSLCRSPIPVIPKDTVNINATITSVEA